MFLTTKLYKKKETHKKNSQIVGGLEKKGYFCHEYMVIESTIYVNAPFSG